jgi:hypothetical protein
MPEVPREIEGTDKERIYLLYPLGFNDVPAISRVSGIAL